MLNTRVNSINICHRKLTILNKGSMLTLKGRLENYCKEGKWGVKTFLRNRCKCLESFRRSNLFITCLCFYFWPEQCPTWKRLVLWTLHTYFHNLVWLKQSLECSCLCHVNRIIICQNWIVWINEDWIEFKNVPKHVWIRHLNAEIPW